MSVTRAQSMSRALKAIYRESESNLSERFKVGIAKTKSSKEMGSHYSKTLEGGHGGMAPSAIPPYPAEGELPSVPPSPPEDAPAAAAAAATDRTEGDVSVVRVDSGMSVQEGAALTNATRRPDPVAYLRGRLHLTAALTAATPAEASEAQAQQQEPAEGAAAAEEEAAAGEEEEGEGEGGEAAPAPPGGVRQGSSSSTAAAVGRLGAASKAAPGRGGKPPRRPRLRRWAGTRASAAASNVCKLRTRSANGRLVGLRGKQHNGLVSETPRSYAYTLDKLVR